MARWTEIAEAGIGVPGVERKRISVAEELLQGAYLDGEVQSFHTQTDEFEVVDPDDLTAKVEEGSTGVSGVDFSGGLDEEPAVDETVGQADDSL